VSSVDEKDHCQIDVEDEVGVERSAKIHSVRVGELKANATEMSEGPGL
jgi:hypothetical protein